MRAKDIVVGEFYRLKGSENYCYAKVLKVLKPKEGENDTRKTLCRCEWVVNIVNKTDKVGLIKYFSASNLKEL